MRWQEAGRRLREMRDAVGLSAYDAGAKVGRRPQSVYGWESGKNRPELAIAKQLGAIYGCRDEVLELYGYAAGRPDLEARVADLEQEVARLGQLLKRLVDVDVASETSKSKPRKRRPIDPAP